MKKVTPCLAFAIVALAALDVHADGDPVRGKTLYESRCIACHSIAANRVGPAHKYVFGRKAGSVADYDYSDALRNSKIVWDSTTLDLWLTNPEKLIAGQKMSYSVADSPDRADLIAYLRQQSGR